jgi:hypothetical protein
MGTIRGATAQDTPLPWIASTGSTELSEISASPPEQELLLEDELLLDDAMAPRAPY